MDNEEKAMAAFQAMDSFINNMSLKTAPFIGLMANNHRTLQQNFTRVCVDWLKYLASCEVGERYDLRNEDSVKFAVKIKEVLDETYLRSV